MVQVVMPGFQDAGGTKYVANEWNSFEDSDMGVVLAVADEVIQ